MHPISLDFWGQFVLVWGHFRHSRQLQNWKIFHPPSPHHRGWRGGGGLWVSLNLQNSNLWKTDTQIIFLYQTLTNIYKMFLCIMYPIFWQTFVYILFIKISCNSCFNFVTKCIWIHMNALNERISKWAHLSFYHKRFSRYWHLNFKKVIF